MPLLLVALAFVGTITTPVVAQEGILASPWEFHVNVYGWLPKAPATIAENDKDLVDVPEDLNTILDSLEMAAMFELEAH